jgi:undecaprenyl-diphosphatase
MELIQKILEADIDLFLLLNSYYSDYWDSIMLIITHKEIWFPFFLVIIFLLVKKYRSKSLLILIFLALTILISDQLSVLIKETVQRLRPVYSPQIQHLVHSVLHNSGQYGFVSSHAANSFAIFFFISRIFRKRGFSLLLFFWALVFSYSRIYLGVHYPGDIICGAILGAFIGIVLYKILMFIENHFFLTQNPKIENTNLDSRQSGLLFLVFCVVTATLFIAVSIIHYYPFL